MKTYMLATAAVLALAPAAAFAQGSTVSGAVGGAVVGAVVGGPVGAVIGAGVGGTVGAAVEPPPEVVTYVQSEEIPTAAPTVQEKVVIGQPVPQTVVLRPVPSHSQFSYAFVNHERVIVDAKTGKVVKIIN